MITKRERTTSLNMYVKKRRKKGVCNNSAINSMYAPFVILNNIIYLLMLIRMNRSNKILIHVSVNVRDMVNCCYPFRNKIKYPNLEDILFQFY